ncbi:MAG: hypothetical protein VX948_18025 [Candidatus Latescibacterota bacterium]|nr:hypothetical protein [Candidatus Latescibacterota bacterium]
MTYTEQVDARAQQIGEAIRERPASSIWMAHAAMFCDQDAALASNLLVENFGHIGDGAFARNAAGTFDVLAAMSVVCRWGDDLTPEALDHVRGMFIDGVLSRGNTENHWLMHYVGSLLACERWASEPIWWNGLTPAATRAEADRWLRGIIERTARCGHHEYDSPQYHPWHLLPMAVLADHAADESLRGLAADAASLFTADMALEYAQGGWAGGHSREGYRENTWTHSGNVSVLQYLYFGGESFDAQRHSHPLGGIAITCRWRPPEILAKIALDDSQRPHVVRKTRAPREIYRHADRNPRPVRKYTYLSPSFALCSTQLGIDPPAGPIDLVSWDLGWGGAKHSAKVVANHPYRSELRFSAFLGGLPQTLRRSIAAPKPYLQCLDRLFGASPYERMVQHEGSILVLYRIPEKDETPYVNLYLPSTASWLEAGDGWLCADIDTTHYVGVRPIGEYGWDLIKEDDHIDGWLLRITDRCAGVAVEAIEAADMEGGFEGFVASRSKILDLDQWPVSGEVMLRTISGSSMGINWPEGSDAQRHVDGRPVDDDCGLYDAPSIADAELGTGRILFEHGSERLELDFDADPSKPMMPMRCIG